MANLKDRMNLGHTAQNPEQKTVQILPKPAQSGMEADNSRLLKTEKNIRELSLSLNSLQLQNRELRQSMAGLQR